MSKTLILSFNSAVTKYSRLNKKVRKSISKGEFWRYTRSKRHYLLHKIERLKRRIAELKFQMKLAGAGLAAGLLMMSAGEASAQASTLGPFEENRIKNPFPKPAFDNHGDPNLFFWDFDLDGDLDASMGNTDYFSQSMTYYKNNGTTTTPVFERYQQDGMYVNWYGTYYNAGRPAYADIDDDGDLDLVVGMGYTTSGSPGVEDDEIYFYRNTGTPETPKFEQEFSDEHPFFNMRIADNAWPAFSDFDNDGDMDFILVGEYYDEIGGNTARLQFFRNDKAGHASGVGPNYTQLEGPTNNPLYMPLVGNSVVSASFADLDGDGDEDFFSTSSTNSIIYKRNDHGVFVEQTGAYTHKANGTSTGNPLEIGGLVAAFEQYASLGFGDLDGDGDTDLVVGTNDYSSSHSPYIYVENAGNGVMVVDQSFSNTITGFLMGNNTTATFFDQDDDGDLDFLTTGHVTQSVGEGEPLDVIAHLYFKNNNGTYEEQTLLNDPFAALVKTGSQGRWQTVDTDGDSDLDALFHYYDYNGTTAIEYYRNDNETFTAIPGLESPLKPILDKHFSNLKLAFGDLNGDGLQDVAVVGNGTIPLFFENTGVAGSPVFEEVVAVKGEPSWYDGLISNLYSDFTPKLVDIDNDGDNDMVLGKYYYVYYYENIGSNTLPEWREYQNQYESDGDEFNLENPFGAIVSNGGVSPDLADVDGDGDKDLLFASTNRGYFTFYENQNPAPDVIPGSTLSLQFVTGQPVPLAPNIKISDKDKDRIVEIRIQTTPYTAGSEKLQLKGTHGNLTALWNDVNGVLTITGNDTIPMYQEALRAVEYVFTGPTSGRTSGKGKDRGKTVQKTVTVFTLDSDLTVSPANTTVFTIQGDDGTAGGPVINTKNKTASSGGNIAFSASQVISDPDGDVDLSTLVVTSQQGAVVTTLDGIVTIDYSSMPNFLGVDIITVYVCDTSGNCTTSTFEVEVQAVPLIYTGMSPNGDGVNDAFQIDFLPNGTQVAIYNRWGDAIFESKNYNIDEPSERFEGKTKNGTDVVAGSYFYKVKYPGGTVKTGYLLLNR